ESFRITDKDGSMRRELAQLFDKLAGCHINHHGMQARHITAPKIKKTRGNGIYTPCRINPTNVRHRSQATRRNTNCYHARGRLISNRTGGEKLCQLAQTLVFRVVSLARGELVQPGIADAGRECDFHELSLTLKQGLADLFFQRRGGGACSHCGSSIW